MTFHKLYMNFITLALCFQFFLSIWTQRSVYLCYGCQTNGSSKGFQVSKMEKKC